MSSHILNSRSIKEEVSLMIKHLMMHTASIVRPTSHDVSFSINASSMSSLRKYFLTICHVSDVLPCPNVDVFMKVLSTDAIFIFRFVCYGPLLISTTLKSSSCRVIVTCPRMISFPFRFSIGEKSCPFFQRLSCHDTSAFSLMSQRLVCRKKRRSN